MSAPVELIAGWQPPVFSKTPEEKAALRRLVSEHVLFKALPDSDIDVLLDAFQGLRFLTGANIMEHSSVTLQAMNESGYPKAAGGDGAV